VRSASVAACLLAAFAASCSELEPEVPAATVERTDVVSARIAELEAQVEGGSLDGALPVDIFAAIRTQPVTPLQAQQPDAAARSDATSADEVDDESTATHVVEAPLSDGDLDGLISMLTTSSGRMRNVPLAEAEQYGAALVPQLAAVLGDEARAGEERAAAAELLAATKTSAAGEALIRTAERSSEAWLRSTCVFRLAELEDDRFVLRLLLRLKYEKDPEAFVWIAHALAQLGNYAGLESLRSLAWNAQDEGVRERARAEFARTAEAVGVDSGDEVLRRWYAADAAALPPREPSAALRLNVWRALSNLSSEHFQLRGVDDARYALANLGHWAAPEIAQALADRDFHVRLHGAQVLERMGLRAHGALDQLVAALDDPELAPQALASLGSLGPDAFEQVAARVHRDQPFEQRVAARRALTRVDPERARPIFISMITSCLGMSPLIFVPGARRSS